MDNYPIARQGMMYSHTTDSLEVNMCQDHSSIQRPMNRMSLNFLLNPTTPAFPSSARVPSVTNGLEPSPFTESSTSHGATRSQNSSTPKECLSNEPCSLLARRQLARSISLPSLKRGFIRCKLCGMEVWGPNGRYHVLTCSVISRARETAKRNNTRLTSVAGISIHPDVFKKGKRLPPRPAKISGFVMSHTVSMADPSVRLTNDEIQSGVPHGRKGYIRCVKCNSEVFAPNAKYHSCLCDNT